MKTVGLFEAKAKLSDICATVARDGTPVLITRRGRGLVKIEPLGRSSRDGAWQARERFVKRNGAIAEELSLPERRTDRLRNPLG